MIDQPEDDHVNEDRQLVLELAEKFLSCIAFNEREKYLSMLTFEIMGEREPPAVSEPAPAPWPATGSPEWEGLPF